MQSIFSHAQYIISRGITLSTGVAAAFLVAGCSGDGVSPAGSRGAQAMRVSFMTSPAVQAGVPSNDTVITLPGSPTGTALQAVSGNDTLIITKVQLVLSRLELTKTTGASCEEDDNAIDSACTEVERSTVLVDLPTDTSVQTVIDATIPAGTYSSLEARLRAEHNGDSQDAAAFLALHPEFQGVNVRVEGTFRGTPFVYTGAADAKLELAFSPPLVVDSTGLNVTIHVDVTSWFLDPIGALIDPTTATAGGENSAVVLDNIRRSFRAFRDDGRDGGDDGDEQQSSPD